MKSLGIIDFPQGDETWQIRALGGLRRNDGDTNNHTIEVFLAPLSHTPVCNYFFPAFAPIGLLPILRIGSVWRNKRYEPGESSHLGNKFPVRIDPESEKIVSAENHIDFFSRCWNLPPDIRRRGHFVQTSGEIGPNKQNCIVLFPCPVAFGHFYAGTSNLATLLCRHPPPNKHLPPDKRWERVFYLVRQDTPRGPLDRSYFKIEDKHVHVCLSALIEDAGYHYAAWFYHEEKARLEAQAIPNRLTVEPGNEQIGYHLKVGLPFTSSPELGCHGVWDQATRTFLVHQVSRCNYRMADTTTVTFDRENDARRVERLPPGARWLERPASDPAPPRKQAPETTPEGGTVTLDPPLGNQEPIHWQVANSIEFLGCTGGKVEKDYRKTEGTSPTPPLTDEEVHEYLGCGESAYVAKAKPGLTVQPPDPPSAAEVEKSLELISQLRNQTGFSHISAVLGVLGEGGWLTTKAFSQGILFDLDTKETPGHQSRKVLLVKLVKVSKRFMLVEFARERRHQSTLTILARPRHPESPPPPRGLLNAVFAGDETWRIIRPLVEAGGWKTIPVSHQSRERNAPVQQTFTFSESVAHHAGKILRYLDREPREG